MATKFTVYSSDASQWAQVMNLALHEKGFTKGTDYDAKEIDLIAAENFDPAYVAINPNGTVPSLVSSDLSQPLVQSTDILRHLDSLRPGNTLVPEDAAAKAKIQSLLDLVHSDLVSTNIILLQARDPAEMNSKKESMWKGFVTNRQAKLEKEGAADPAHPFYGPKTEQNSPVHKIYTTELGPHHDAFFHMSHDLYRGFASGMDQLETQLVLPYAAGDAVTEADFHIVPWLSHALWGANTNPTEIQNFDVLEALIQKSVPDFKVGPRTKAWWANISATPAFKAIYPVLH